MQAMAVRIVGKIVAAGLLIGVAATTSGCTKLLKKKGSDAGVGSTTSSVSQNAQDIADEQLQDKLDEYIKCLNSLSSAIHQSRHRYFFFIPPNGPTGKEQNADLFRLPVGATAACQAGVAKSKSMPPSDAKLESAGNEFAVAAIEIDKLMNEAGNYFEMKLFKDDKWAKGKALHPKLKASWDRFSRADKQLHDTLDGITKPLAQRTLARIEREEGKKFRYHRKHVLITSRELVEASDPIGEDDEIDFNLYSASYTDFEKALDDLVAYGGLHKADLSNQHGPNWPMADSNFDQFVKEATDFKKAAKEHWRCLRDAPAKAKTPSGKIDTEKLGNCGDGPAFKQAQAVIKGYNEFIRTSNNHQFP
jgi:hypothetical protein